MELVIWVETRIAGRTVDRQEVAKIERPASLRAIEEIGLTLPDGKAVIRKYNVRSSRCSSRSNASYANIA